MKRHQRKPSTASRQNVPETSISTLGIYPRQFTPEEASAKFPSYLTSVVNMAINKEHCDTKVVIGEETFECHMIVLKGYSEYFADLDKNKEFDTQTVFLPEEQVSAAAFNIIYEWMLSDDNIPVRVHFAAVYKAAHFLKVHEYLGQFMCIIDDKKVIGEREALSIYLEAKEVNEKSLQDLMLPKISKLFLTFVASWEYLVLSYEEVEDFFQSNAVGVNSELDMLFAAIRWLQHEWPQRHKSVTRLMKCVRFELMNSWQLVELKKYPQEFKHIFKIPEVQEIIDTALSSIMLQCSNHGDGDNASKVLNRRIINDSTWNAFEFEKTTNFSQNYQNFCMYLKQLNGNQWQKIKYADPKHESVIP